MNIQLTRRALLAAGGAFAASAVLGQDVAERRPFFNFKPANTRHLREGLARVRARSGRLTIACLGDSTTAGAGATTGKSGEVDAYPDSYPEVLKGILNAQLAPAIDGAVWGRSNAGAIPYGTFDPRLSLGSGWTSSVASIGGAMWTNAATTDALVFAPEEAFDTIEVYSVQNPGHGTFTVDVGGAVLATVNADGAKSYVKTTVSCARGRHSINIRRTGAGREVFIGGVVVSNSAAPAISVWNWGWSGSKATDWANAKNPWEPANAVKTAAADVVIYALGINDMGKTPIERFKESVHTVVGSALAAGDCFIMLPNPVSVGAHSQADQDSVRQALLEVATARDLPVIDRHQIFESYERASSRRWMFDGVHPNKAGYAATASLVARAIEAAAR